jgi:hypothetical protein
MTIPFSKHDKFIQSVRNPPEQYLTAQLDQRKTVNFPDNQNCDTVLLRELEKRDAKRHNQTQRGGGAAGDRPQAPDKT